MRRQAWIQSWTGNRWTSWWERNWNDGSLTTKYRRLASARPLPLFLLSSAHAIPDQLHLFPPRAQMPLPLGPVTFEEFCYMTTFGVPQFVLQVRVWCSALGRNYLVTFLKVELHTKHTQISIPRSAVLPHAHSYRINSAAQKLFI